MPGASFSTAITRIWTLIVIIIAIFSIQATALGDIGDLGSTFAETQRDPQEVTAPALLQDSESHLTSVGDGLLFSYHLLTAEEGDQMMAEAQVRDDAADYNVLIDGHGTGLTPPTEKEWELMVGDLRVVEEIEFTPLGSPSSVDLSVEPYFPEVRSQGGQGSCAAWAMTYYAYGYLEAKDNGWTDASMGNDNHLMSPAWTYNKVNGGRDYGSSMYRNAQVIAEWGVASLETMPYDSSDPVSWGDQWAWREAPLHRATGVYTISYSGDTTVTQVKELLASGTPITFAIDANQYSNGFADGNHIISSLEYSSSTVNHAQCIVGYDDSVTDDGETGAFRVVNSWGTYWGDEGYYWLSYSAFKEIGYLLSITFTSDKADYQPKMLATWHFDAAPSRETNIEVGIGPFSSPIEYKVPYLGKNVNGYDHRFPTFMCMDITELMDSWEAGKHSFYIYIGETDLVGQISSFRIEIYDDQYLPGMCSRISGQSSGLPKFNPDTVENGMDDYDFIDLASALDVESGQVSTQGVAGWTGVRSLSHDGVGSAQSGDVGDGGESTMILSLEGPATYQFWWSVSSEPGEDSLSLTIDGELEANISGIVDWETRSFSLGPGEHEVRFVYQKDASISQQDDCGWVDGLCIVPPHIWIDGDAELQSIASSLGLEGVGSAAEPYIIEGMSVDAMGRGASIYIGNTTLHFVVRNCSLQNASDEGSLMAPGAALSLFNVSNGSIEGNLLEESDHGLSLRACQGITIRGNEISGNGGSGLAMHSSVGCEVIDNLFSQNAGFGADLRSCSDNTLTENIFDRNRGSGSIYDPDTIQAYDDTDVNSWSAGNLGNYWEDLTLPDGEEDCIVDTPYLIGDNQDPFPLAFDVSAPWDLTASESGSEIKLTWSLPNYSAYWTITGQRVYSNSSGLVLEAELDPAETSYLLPLPTVDSEYLVRAVISSGQEGPDSNKIVIEAQDIEAPIVTITAPSQGDYLGSSVTVTWTSSDDDGIDHFEIRADDGTWIDVGTDQSYAFDSLDEGAHVVWVMVFDISDNQGNDSVSFTVDITPPMLEIISPVSDALVQSTSVTVVWSSSDSVSGISNAQIRLDGGNWIPRYTLSQHTFVGLDQGQHEVEVEVYDRAGHSALDVVGFSVDTISPTVTIIAPSEAAQCVLNDTDVTIEWTGSDAGSGLLDGFWIIVDAQPSLHVGDTFLYQLYLSPGSHHVTVTAEDMAGNQGADSIDIEIDITSPSLEIITPQEGQLIEEEEVTVTWEGTDDSGLKGYWVRLDSDSWVSKQMDQEHTFGPLADGDHLVSVRAEDVAGNSVTKSINLTVWSTPLSVRVLSPTQNGISNLSDLLVEWEVIGALKGIQHCEILLDDGSWQNLGPVNSTLLSSIPDGAHLLAVRAYDNGGRSAQATVDFQIDTEAPILILISPTPDQAINTSYLTVRWTEQDNGSGLFTCQLRLDYGSWINTRGRDQYTITSLHSGGHTVHVRAYDKAGNVAIVSANFTVVGLHLGVEILSPLNNTLLGVAEIVVQWSGSDSGIGISHYLIRLDDGAWQNVGLDNECNMTIPDGEHIIWVMMVALDDQNVSDSVTVMADTTPPLLTIITPSEGEKLGESDVSISWLGSDGTSGIASYWISMDLIQWENLGLITSLDLIDLEEGEHRIGIRAYDSLGNNRTAWVVFVVDLTAPSLTILSPLEGMITNLSSMSVSWEAEDQWGIDTVRLKLDDDHWSNCTGTFSRTLTGLTHGNHMILLEATDIAGNVRSVSVEISVDLEPPLLEILSPVPGQFLNDTQVAVEWSSESPDIQLYQIRLDGGPWRDMGTQLSTLIEGLGEGQHLVEVRCMDVAGNQDVYGVTVIVDTTPPSVEIHSPTQGAIYTQQGLVLNWSGNDGGSGISHYMAMIDSANWYRVEVGFTAILTEVVEGEHRFVVTAFDKAGNFFTTELGFAVDIQGPWLNIASPSDGEFINHDTIEMTWEGGDAVSDIDCYHIRVDNGDWIGMGLNLSHSLILEDGEHIIMLRAWDGVGHLSQVTVNVTVDTLPPGIADFAPSSDVVGLDVIVWVELTGNDLAGAIMWIDGLDDESVLLECNISMSLQDLTPGTWYTVHVRAWDCAANELNHSWSFRTQMLVVLSGTVIDTEQRPLAYALVALDTGESTVTDDQGRFSLETTPGLRTLDVVKEGYHMESITLEVGEQNLTLEAELEKTEMGLLGIDWMIVVGVAVGILLAVQLIIMIRKRN